jgi:hypothetical protein
MATAIAPARTVLADPGNPLSAHGLVASDPAEKFWDFFAARMKAQYRKAIADIGEALADDWGCVTVGLLCNPDLYLGDVEEIFTDNGGKKGWVTSIQALLNFKYRTLSSSAPESASVLTEQASVNAPRAKKERFDRAHKLGAYLKSMGQMAGCVVPKADIEAAIIETAEPRKTRLTFNDSKRTAGVVYHYVAKEYKSVGGCKDLFEHLEKQLRDVMGLAPHRGTWFTVLQNRFESGRRTDAAVWPHHAHFRRTPHSLFPCDAPHVCAACL